MAENVDTTLIDPLALARFPYEFVRLGTRCAAFVEPRGLSNVGVIEGEDGLLLVDSTIHPYYLKSIVGELDQRFGKPILFLVNTHFHRDHTFGNVAVAVKHGIIAHARCAAYFDAYCPALLEEYRSFYADQPFRLRRPEIVVDLKRWRVEGFDVAVEILHVGGHTHDSCLVWVPEDAILFAGDTVFNRVQPYVAHWSCLDHFGRVGDWIAALETALSLRPNATVPGHGVVADETDIRRLIRFFEHYARRVELGVKAGKPLRVIWREIYRERDFRWEGGDTDMYLYMTMSLFDELTGPATLYEKT